MALTRLLESQEPREMGQYPSHQEKYNFPGSKQECQQASTNQNQLVTLITLYAKLIMELSNQGITTCPIKQIYKEGENHKIVVNKKVSMLDQDW